MVKSKQLRTQLWVAKGAKPLKLGWKNHIISYLKYHLSACKTSLANVLRSPITTLLTTLAIGIGLSMPASLFLGVKNLRALSPDWSNQIVITALLSSESSLNDAAILQEKFKQTPFLKHTHVITREEALVEFQQHSGFTDLETLLPHNPLPHVVQFQFENDVDLAVLNQFKEALNQFHGVEQVIYERDWVERLQGVVRFGESLFDSLAILISLGITFMIGTLIRLTLERHREEVEVLHLIGATAHFIRRPFLYRGMILGIFGGIISICIMQLLLIGIEARANHMISIYNGLFTLKKFSISDTLVLLGISTLLGWLGAWLAFAHNQKSLHLAS